MDTEFRWLHLSDLHVGMTDHGWLWPGMKHVILEDLERLHSRLGPWDLVIFSGDLTQQGLKAEFTKLDAILSEIWRLFHRLGFNPALLTIPGNHDLQWPTRGRPELVALRRWWDEPDVREGFFDPKPNNYRRFIAEAFSNYSNWEKRRGSKGLTAPAAKRGLLPGDQAVTFQAGDRRVGVVALNSTWLQLGGEDYKGKLHIDPKQLHAVTEGDPVAWSQRHALNILVTHQPPDWLHSESLELWNSEINVPGWFDVHLFGHMHEGEVRSTSEAGSAVRSSIQAASVFGLEYTRKQIARIHGYSIAQFAVRDSRKEVRLWPRRLHRAHGGEKYLGADTRFKTENESLLVLDQALSPGQSLARAIPTASGSASSEVKFFPKGLLEKVRYHLPTSRAHSNVRRIEQQRLATALAGPRAAWLSADSDMGSDEFVSSVQKLSEDAHRPTYRLDLAEFARRDDFAGIVHHELRCGVEYLSSVLAEEDRAYLILDNVAAEAPHRKRIQAEREAEELTRVLLDYCPKLLVILRSRRAPLHNKLPAIELRALDEADLRSYLSEHEHGQRRFSDPEAVSAVHGLTDGVPELVDKALEALCSHSERVRQVEF
jgi:predicted MPP superfamily phosphohydrolase